MFGRNVEMEMECIGGRERGAIDIEVRWREIERQRGRESEREVETGHMR